MAPPFRERKAGAQLAIPSPMIAEDRAVMNESHPPDGAKPVLYLAIEAERYENGSFHLKVCFTYLLGPQHSACEWRDSDRI
jgi:hypothetical protein